MPDTRWPRSGRYGTPQGCGTPPRAKATEPCRIRDGRPRGSRDGRPRGSRDGRPQGPIARYGPSGWARDRVAGWATARVAGWATARVAGWATARVAPTGLVAGLFGRRGDACRRPCRFADGLVRVGTGRRKGVARRLARRQRSRAGFGMGDGAPFGRDRVAGWATARVAGWATARVAGWATARVAPTGLVAGLFGRRGDACRRPCRFPDGLVRVGTGRRKGVARRLARRQRSRAGFGMGDRKGRPYAGLEDSVSPRAAGSWLCRDQNGARVPARGEPSCPLPRRRIARPTSCSHRQPSGEPGPDCASDTAGAAYPSACAQVRIRNQHGPRWTASGRLARGAGHRQADDGPQLSDFLGCHLLPGTPR